MARRTGSLACGLVLLAAAGWAGEFRIEEAQFAQASGIGSGARAMGMGGAFIAIADDATAASWNPAGVSQLLKPEASLSIQVRNDFRTASPARNLSDGRVTAFEIDRGGSGLEFLSVVYPIKKETWRVVGEFSYQRVLTMSLDTDASYQAFFSGGRGEDHVFSSRMSGGFDAYAFTLGVGKEKLSGGLSLNIWANGPKEEQRYVIDVYDVSTLKETTKEVRYREDSITGVNATLGVLARPIEKLSVGLVFKTPFTADYEISESWPIPPPLWQRSGTAKIDWPYTVGAGVAGKPFERTTVAFDYNRTNWSGAEIRDVPGFQGQILAPEPYPTGDADQPDTDQFRFGGEYVHMHKGLLLPVRAGFFVDRTFGRDFKHDRITYKGFTLGAGVGYRKFIMDVAWVREAAAYPVEFASEKERVTLNRVLFSTVVRP